MRALVTGASGLIGANIIRVLLDNGVAVRAMTRAGSDRRTLAGLLVEHVTGDLFDSPASLAKLCHGCEFVFHTAARFAYGAAHAAGLERVAVEGTRHIMEAAGLARVGRAVITSSSVVFGSTVQPVVRDETMRPDDGFVEPPYVLAKIAQDALALELGRRYGVEVVLACPTMCVGAHGTTLGPSNGAIVAYLNDPLRLTYPGGCNIVSARDAAQGHWLLAKSGVAGEHYVLGAENLCWSEIHATIAALCGVQGPRLEINHALAYLAATFEEARAVIHNHTALTTRDQARMIGRYYWYSHAKAAMLGYAPMPARAALAEACGWLVTTRHISRDVRATISLADEVHQARRKLATS